MSKKKEETVELTVKVPERIIRFYRDWLGFMGAKETAEEYIKSDMLNHLTSVTGEVIAETCDNMFYDGVKEVVEKYGLQDCVKAQGIPLKPTVDLTLPKEDYDALEFLGKRHGLNVKEATEVAMLISLHKDNLKLYEAAKKTVEPHVVKVAEKVINLK